MKTLEMNEMEVIEGGRFLGIGRHSRRVGHAYDAPNCESGRAIAHENTYTIFWVTAVHLDSTEECLAPFS